MSVTAARSVALKTLAAVRERDAYLGPVLEAQLSRATLSEADHALVTRLARGVIEALGTLDDVLDARIAKPGSVEPRVRDALRLAAYEILFMRTPARAAVHQGVEAVRRVRPQASGLANAVLRRLADEADTFPWGDPAADPTVMARAAGHPLWLVKMVAEESGFDVARLMLDANNEPAPLYLRHNPFVAPLDEALSILAADGAEPRISPPDASSVVVQHERAAVRGRALSEGYFLVTDAAAQMAPLAVAARPGMKILDAGAGRGTKTLSLQAAAVLAGGPADILSLDVHDFKTKLLRERMDTLGVPGVETVTGDILDPSSIPTPDDGFDAVLLDAPCTGLGTLRRHPEQRWRVSADDVERMAELQGSMLSAVASLVRPGGHVVYSTCSVAHAENDGVIEGFLNSPAGSEFRTVSVADIVPAEWQHYLTSQGWFRSIPEPGGPDGHFVARLERQASEA
ncbi:MAG: antitermination protein NusB [Actinobacteria bacterium HGW-Actinobacteria-1]|jgi:16S rRNA (cytosine967-C5)-methyltransferase|nr:MAG: antitermination protein NusB [Actinobacteria bacterium HGW-Actinobacteria-1]